MDSKSYAYLDRYAKLQPHSNFLLYHANYSLTPLELKRKRILAFYLKKLKKFVYSAESDQKILDLCIGILNYLMISYNPETQKVEAQLLQNLEDLTFIIYIYTQEDEIFTQYFNHLTQLSKRKQKYVNVFSQIQRIVGLMTMTKKSKQIPDFLVNLYNQNSDHMNNIKFALLLNTFNTLPRNYFLKYICIYKFSNFFISNSINLQFHSQIQFQYKKDQFQLKSYKEKLLKDKNITTDMILDLAKQTQNEETIEEVLNILRLYKNDFHGADSFLIKKQYFQLAYENGDQLEKEEIMEFLNADLFDLEYVHSIISYIEFFIDDHKSFVKEVILKVLEFSYGNNYLWGKLVKIFTISDQEQPQQSDSEEDQDSNRNQSMQFEDEEGDEDESGKDERKSKKKKNINQKNNQVIQFDDNEIEILAKVQYSGKYKKKDFNILKKIVSYQNLSPKISEKNSLHQFLHNKYTLLENILSTKDNHLLKEYKQQFDELQQKNTSMVLK